MLIALHASRIGAASASAVIPACAGMTKYLIRARAHQCANESRSLLTWNRQTLHDFNRVAGEDREVRVTLEQLRRSLMRFGLHDNVPGHFVLRVLHASQRNTLRLAKSPARSDETRTEIVPAFRGAENEDCPRFLVPAPRYAPSSARNCAFASAVRSEVCSGPGKAPDATSRANSRDAATMSCATFR